MAEEDQKKKKILKYLGIGAVGIASIFGIVGYATEKAENTRLSAKNEELTRVNHILGKKLNEAFYHLGKEKGGFRQVVDD